MGGNRVPSTRRPCMMPHSGSEAASFCLGLPVVYWASVSSSRGDIAWSSRRGMWRISFSKTGKCSPFKITPLRAIESLMFSTTPELPASWTMVFILDPITRGTGKQQSTLASIWLSSNYRNRDRNFRSSFLLLETTSFVPSTHGLSDFEAIRTEAIYHGHLCTDRWPQGLPPVSSVRRLV